MWLRCSSRLGRQRKRHTQAKITRISLWLSVYRHTTHAAHRPQRCASQVIVVDTIVQHLCLRPVRASGLGDNCQPCPTCVLAIRVGATRSRRHISCNGDGSAFRAMGRLVTDQPLGGRVNATTKHAADVVSSEEPREPCVRNSCAKLIHRERKLQGHTQSGEGGILLHACDTAHTRFHDTQSGKAMHTTVTSGSHAIHGPPSATKVRNHILCCGFRDRRHD